jgi:hypothetical protein
MIILRIMLLSSHIAHNATHVILRRMATENRDQKVPVLFTPTELRELDDWSFAQRIRSRGEAIRRLIALGLAAARDDDKAPYDPGPRQKVKT